MDTCIENLKFLKLNNPKNDAWAGQIEIRVDKKPVRINCQGCTGSSILKNGSIVLDGDSNSKEYADTHCLNGETCSLYWPVWDIKGI